jgi:hemoglobin
MVARRVERRGMNEQVIADGMDAAALRRLTAAFYRRVREDDLIGPRYPEGDWEGAEERLADFLCFRLLGEMKYIEERGHPRLRMRHVGFAIGVAERDRWLALMGAAMEECGVAEAVRVELRAFFGQVADFMRNRPEPGV